jgi:tape measure domain-containing protein
MSSRNIEREIVQMEFDARKFTKGIDTSAKSLSDFKKGFNMTGAQQSLAELDKASDSVDFSTMQRGLTNVTAGFSVMGTVGFTVINRLTNAVIDSGKKLASTLFVDPVKTGLEEYETQLNAVQTILANTQKQGTTLDDVNAALDELNEYADLTIYNFTEMTSAIGRFTTAGIDLDTSVEAIKGLSNIAAVSGANATDAARAQYQLSQALSSGVIRLQDWMSLENANIASEVFKDSIKETARLHGVNVDAMIAKHGTLRLSLQDQWLTTEIMLDTLSKFTGEMSDEQLLAMGYTESQVADIQELAQTALDAATKIKTITQLTDVLKEALQSGWAQTWRIVLGDFEQAKELWGRVAEVFTGVIDQSSAARNYLLQMWADTGGRTKVIEGIFNLVAVGSKILRGFADAIGSMFEPIHWLDLWNASGAFLEFTERVKMAVSSGWMFKFQSIVRGIASAIDIVRLVLFAVLRPIKDLIFGMSGASDIFEKAANLGDMITAFRRFAIETDLFNNIVSDVIAYVGTLIDRLGKLVDEFLELEIIQDIIGWFQQLTKQDFLNVWNGILLVVRLLIAPFYLLGIAVRDLAIEFAKLEVIKKVVSYLKSVSWKATKEGFIEMAASVKEFFANIRNSEILAKFVTLIKTFDGRRVTQFLEDGKEGFGWLSGIIERLTGLIKGLNIETSGASASFTELGESIKSGINTALDWLITNAETIDYSGLFDVINAGLLSGLLLSLRKLVSGGLLGGLLGDGAEDITEGITDSLEEFQGVLGAYQTNIKAEALQKIAIAIGIFAASIFLLTLVDSTKLKTVSLTIAAMLATLFGSSAIMSQINTKDMAKAAIAIIGISVALSIASIGLSKISKIEPDRITSALAAMGVGLASLVLTVNSIKGGQKAAANVIMLMGIGAALLILATSIEKFGNIEMDVLLQGLTSIGVVLAGFVAYTRLIQPKGMIEAGVALTIIAGSLLILKEAVKSFGQEEEMGVLTQGLTAIGLALAGFAAYSRLVKPEGMIKAAVAITVISAALLVLGLAIKNIGGLDQEALIQGLVGIAAGLLILVLAANLMTGALAGAFAILIMSIAITALAVALKIIGSMSIEQLLIALAGLAGVFIILGLAGLILTPLVPVLLLLGAAMLLIGAGAALMGVGVFLAATGLVALAASGAAVAAMIGVVGLAIVEILPKIAEALANAIATFLTFIAEKMPEIIEAFKTIVLGLLTAITELIPDIVIAILDMITAILEAIALRLPDLIQAGYDILLAFIQGIGDNIAEVVASGLYVLTEFINGIAEGLPDLVESAFNLILTFLNAIADAIEEYMPQIIAAGVRIGEAIIDGLVEAINSGLGAVWHAIRKLAEGALQRLKDMFWITSPSRRTYEIGEQVVQGLVNAFFDGIPPIRDSMDKIVTTVQDELSPLETMLSDNINAEWEFNPIVRPILDLDAISRPDDLVGDLFQKVPIGLDRSEGYVSSSDDGITDDSQSQEGVTFNQYNYSPKALDRSEIYRQTKTQVAQLERRELNS